MSPLKAKKTLVAKQPLKSKARLKPKPAPKKRAKPSVSKLKKEADRLHSLATRLRFAQKQGGELVAKCVTCTNPEWKPIKVLQCGHFMSRRFNSTRYDEENTAPQCYGDNIMQQGKQYEFGLWIDKFYGEGTAMKLSKLSKQPHQWKAQELLGIIADREEEIRFYERGRVWEK